MNVTVCGAGNAAQTLIAQLAANGRHQVVVYAPLGDEARRLSAALADAALTADFADGPSVAGRPQVITADPAVAGAHAELVMLALPAFAHETVLAALAPHLPAHAWIGALPGRGGFDWAAQALLPAHQGPIFGLQTLPWACRIQEWGRRVQVLGVKAQVGLAAWPAAMTDTVVATLSALLDVPLQPVGSLLALTLANTGQIIHPGIMYGQFHNWDGHPLDADAIPLFYGDVNTATADVLQAISDEIQAVCRALAACLPAFDAHAVAPVYDWLLAAYAGQIDDAGTLAAAFNTNRAYAGIRVPVKPAGAGRYVPDFAVRYLAEDIPYGLLVTRGIAEIAGVATPTICRVITWAQARLGQVYLTGDRVDGPAVARSRAPQRFGLRTPEALLAQPAHA